MLGVGGGDVVVWRSGGVGGDYSVGRLGDVAVSRVGSVLTINGVFMGVLPARGPETDVCPYV